MADINGDSVNDLVVGGSLGKVYLYTGYSITDFISHSSIEVESQSSSSGIRSPFFADMNQDGLIDILVTASYSPVGSDSMVTIIPNVGTETSPSFGAPEQISFTIGIKFVVDVADYTGNGRPDLLASVYPTGLMLFENLGGNQFGPGQEVPVNDPDLYDNYYITGSAVDFDGDGVKEIILTQTPDSPGGDTPVIICRCSCMGIEDSHAAGEILLGVTVNPTGGITSAVVHLAEPSAVDLTVYSLDGRLVHRIDAPVSEGENLINLDLSGEPSGIYLLRAASESGFCSEVRFTLLP